MKDALKGYLALATGLTEVTRQRATTAAKALVAQGEATASQVQALADDLVQQSKTNREAVTALVRYEVDKGLARVGLVSKDEVEALNARIKSLETELRAARGSAPAGATKPVARSAPAPAKETAAKQAPVKKAPAKKAAAKKAAAKKAPAQQAAPAKAPATSAPSGG